MTLELNLPIWTPFSQQSQVLNESFDEVYTLNMRSSRVSKDVEWKCIQPKELSKRLRVVGGISNWFIDSNVLKLKMKDLSSNRNSWKLKSSKIPKLYPQIHK